MTEHNPVIRAVILAAGESTRMNGPKLTLPYGGRTIIENLALNILESSVADIMVVLGAWREETGRAIERLPVRKCINERYKEGMLSSVICGLKNLPDDTDAAVIIPGDQPGISARVTDILISAYREEGKGIIIASYEGRKGHPILISRKYFREIERLDPSKGLRELQSKFSDDVHVAETNDEMTITDIDTREDYLDAINKSQ